MDDYEDYLYKYAGNTTNPLFQPIKLRKNGTVVFKVPVIPSKMNIVLISIIAIVIIIATLYFSQNVIISEKYEAINNHIVMCFLTIVCLTWGLYYIGWLNAYTIVLKRKFAWLNIDKYDEKEIVNIIRNNAFNRGFVHERYLNTYQVENTCYRAKNGVTEIPLEEQFWLYTKINTYDFADFCEEKIAVYRAPYYNAEIVTGGKGLTVRAKTIYKEFFDLFCGKQQYSREQEDPSNPINSILLVIVDKMDILLENILIRFHLNSILFCVITLEEPTKLYIGTDLRNTQDDDYRNRIKELVELLDIKDVDEKYINEYFAKNIIK